MTIVGNTVSEYVKNLVATFVVIIAIGGWVTKVEVNHSNDRSDIDNITKTLTRLEKGQDALLENQKETQETIIDGNKVTMNAIFEIKLHQQEEDDKQDLSKQLKP